MSTIIPTPLLTKQQAATLLAVSVQTISRLIRHKTLTAIKIGRQVRITQESVDHYLTEKGVRS